MCSDILKCSSIKTAFMLSNRQHMISTFALFLSFFDCVTAGRWCLSPAATSIAVLSTAFTTRVLTQLVMCNLEQMQWCVSGKFCYCRTIIVGKFLPKESICFQLSNVEFFTQFIKIAITQSNFDLSMKFKLQNQAESNLHHFC